MLSFSTKLHLNYKLYNLVNRVVLSSYIQNIFYFFASNIKAKKHYLKLNNFIYLNDNNRNDIQVKINYLFNFFNSLIFIIKKLLEKLYNAF
jgi:hypothetical protein